MRKQIAPSFAATIKQQSTGPTAWLPFGPFKGKNIVAEACWSTGSTSGTRTQLQGCFSTLSTEIMQIVLFKSSAGGRGQKASTSGVASKAIRFIRMKSTAAGVTSTKTVTVTVAGFST